MGVMICPGQGGLRSLSASSFLYVPVMVLSLCHCIAPTHIYLLRSRVQTCLPVDAVFIIIIIIMFRPLAEGWMQWSSILGGVVPV